jgi:hypothetical protein
MPFRTFTWPQSGFELGSTRPDPELRQFDTNRFFVLKSFCYRAPQGDPDPGMVYVVPGTDFRRPAAAAAAEPERREPIPDDSIVVPSDTTGETDLASVPPVFWWLVASYGNHTRAVLLHDALYANGEAPVPRRTADRLLLSALRESPDKAGPFRHWLMWAAVSGFGTMRHRLGVLFAAHVVAVWSLTIGAVAWAWGDGIAGISWTWWQAILAGMGALVFLIVLGSSWRAGVDLAGGWLVPTLLTAAMVFVPLAIEWTYPFELDWSPFTLLAGAGVLTLLGPLWGLWVDPTLRGWLWPTALIGLPLAVVPAVLIVVALLLIWLIDFGAAISASQRKTPAGEERDFELPTIEQTRVAL